MQIAGTFPAGAYRPGFAIGSLFYTRDYDATGGLFRFGGSMGQSRMEPGADPGWLAFARLADIMLTFPVSAVVNTCGEVSPLSVVAGPWKWGVPFSSQSEHFLNLVRSRRLGWTPLQILSFLRYFH